MRTRNVLVIAATLLVVGGAAALWFIGRESPDAVDLGRAVAELAALEPESSPEGEGTDEGQSAPIDPTGTWTVDTAAVPFDHIDGTGTWVGYRIDEELSGVGAFTAVGRTPRVDGEVVIEGSQVIAAEIRADLVGLRSDSGNRDARVSPLFTDRPASFTLTDAFALGGGPGEVQQVVTTVEGLLRIGEVERPVAFELSADVVGQRIVVAGSTRVRLADFAVVVPSAPVVLSVSDEATVELLLYLARS